MGHSGFIYIYNMQYKIYTKDRELINSSMQKNVSWETHVFGWTPNHHSIMLPKLFKPLESHQQPTSGQVIIFHQPSFPWTKGFPSSFGLVGRDLVKSKPPPRKREANVALVAMKTTLSVDIKEVQTACLRHHSNVRGKMMITPKIAPFEGLVVPHR